MALPWTYFGVLRERILAAFDGALPEFKFVADRLAVISTP
jgi:hypothetical protein